VGEQGGRYRGTVAVDVTVPGTEPPIRLLALDARERGFTLRGITAPGRRADGTVGGTPVPFWIAEATRARGTTRPRAAPAVTTTAARRGTRTSSPRSPTTPARCD
jgi:hypothetical protein